MKDPGPGQYEDNYRIFKKSDPKTVFGRAEKMKGLKKTNAPGVGSYDVGLYDIRKNTRGYSLGKSNRFKNFQVLFFFKHKYNILSQRIHRIAPIQTIQVQELTIFQLTKQKKIQDDLFLGRLQEILACCKAPYFQAQDITLIKIKAFKIIKRASVFQNHQEIHLKSIILT